MKKKEPQEKVAAESIEKVCKRHREKSADRYGRPVLVYEDDPGQVPVYATRFRKLNRLLGGGLPPGSTTEIGGLFEGGKSALAASLAADVQKAAPDDQKVVALFNFEHRLDKQASWTWWRTLGLDTSPERFKLYMPNSIEEGMPLFFELLETGRVCCAVIDSVYAAGSRDSAEAVKAMGDPSGKKAPIGVEAAKWGTIWTAAVPLLSRTGAVCLAVNQVRQVINMGGGRGGYGPQYETGRGDALKFYSWFRLQLTSTQLDPEKWGKDGDVDGKHVRIKVIKNGINAAARGVARFDIIRGEGWDLVGDLIESALELGAIEHAGSGIYNMDGGRIARGADKLRAEVLSRPKLREVLEQKVEALMAAVPDEEVGKEEPEEAPAPAEASAETEETTAQ